jgi:signal transduction histidine kinase
MSALRNTVLVVCLAVFPGAGCSMKSARVAMAPADSAPATATRPSPAPRRILVLFDEDKDNFPGLSTVDRRLRHAFEAAYGNSVEMHSESLGLSRSSRAGYDDELAAFLRAKYADWAPQLVVAVLEPPLDFLLRQADSLFPGVPVVFSGVDATTIKDKKLPANFTGVLLKREFAATLEVALKLQPEVRNVFVVIGASRFDRYLEAFVRRDLKPFEGRVAFDYLVGLTMDQYLERLSRLPPKSAILYVTVFVDGAGRRYIPHDVVARLAAVANAPIYVFLDQFVGLGVVGGNVYSTDGHGDDIAALGRRILDGASPASLAVRAPAAQFDMFDARQLRRWKLDESRVPAGSLVRFHEPTAWELYRGYIVTAAALVLLQALLIGGLLVARRRQALAEAEARRQRDDLAHVLRVTTLGELTSSLAHEVSQPIGAILLNAESAIRYLEGTSAPDEDIKETLEDIMHSAEHASLVIDRLRAHFRKERSRYVALDVKVMIENVVRLLHRAMLTERIEIRLVFGEHVGAVQGDRVQLEQVLLNIVRNACDAIGASTDGPRLITIGTRESRAGYVVVEVSDTGVGLAGEDVERIFEHFFSTKPQGLGMGLAISRSIIEAHGGRVWASANAGRGLTLHIELEGATASRERPETAATGSAR